MRKTLLIYFGFGIVCVVVSLVFLTATTYIQLALAILLYPLLVLFAYKIFTHKSRSSANSLRKTQRLIQQQVQSQEKVESTKTENITVSDINKRTFLKLIGATGISFFLITIFGRRIESLFFGQNSMQIPSSTGNPPTNKTDTIPSSPTEGYNISELDDSIISYFGFVNKDGAWFIMNGDSNTGSYRYVKGESNFPGNWKNRANLKYDYFHKVFSQT